MRGDDVPCKVGLHFKQGNSGHALANRMRLGRAKLEQGGSEWTGYGSCWLSE